MNRRDTHGNGVTQNSGYLFTPSEHGGNIYKAAKKLGIKECDIIDFSANINPLGTPENVVKAVKRSINKLSHYPDPDASDLTLELAKHLQVLPESIICGNGSTELIYLIVRALKPKNVLIPAPTLSEYERVCKSYGAEVKHYRLKEENDFDIDVDEFIDSIVGANGRSPLLHSKTVILNETKWNEESRRLPVIDSSAVPQNDIIGQPASKRNIDMVFLCNPNNPTGRLLRKRDVLKIAEAVKAYGIYLIVDEAFIDFVPNESVIHNVETNPYLIVLRSMTKFYALAGLRLGYGVFPKNIVNIIKQYKEPWTVNTLAQIAGIAALKDILYKNATYTLIDMEKRFFESNFRKAGIRFFQSYANFYLLKLPDADQLYSNLMEKGMLVRLCSDFKGLDKTYIRIAIRTRGENIQLLSVLMPHKSISLG